jgi:hypothetical protein
MDFQTFKNRLQFALGGWDEDATYLDVWINRAYIDLTTVNKFVRWKLPWYFDIPKLDKSTTINTTQNQDYIALPSDLLFIINVKDTTNDTDLKPKDIRWIDKNKSSTASEPTYYARFGSNLYFDCPAGGTYAIEIKYRKRIALLSANGDEPELDDEWQEAMLILAKYYAYSDLLEFDKAREMKTQFIEFVREHLGILERETMDKEGKIKPAWRYISGGY